MLSPKTLNPQPYSKPKAVHELKDFRASFGDTALILALTAGHTEIVSLLLGARADPAVRGTWATVASDPRPKPETL